MKKAYAALPGIFIAMKLRGVVVSCAFDVFGNKLNAVVQIVNPAFCKGGRDRCKMVVMGPVFLKPGGGMRSNLYVSLHDRNNGPDLSSSVHRDRYLRRLMYTIVS